MSTRKFIRLTSFILLLFVLVAMALADVVKASIAPQPVPTPEPVWETAVSHPTNHAAGLILPAIMMLFSLGVLLTWCKRQWVQSNTQFTPKHIVGSGTVVLLSLLLMSCQSPSADPLPPDDYLDHALNWLEANAVTAVSADWEAIRTEAIGIVDQPQTTADTYPAIEYAIAQINDPHAFFRTPEIDVWERGDLGLTAVYPQNIITEVKRGSAAEAANIQVGDQLLTIDGQPPVPLENRTRLVDFPPEVLELTAAQVAWWLRRGGGGNISSLSDYNRQF